MVRRRGPAGRRRPWPRRGDPVNVGRGPIVDYTALVRALGNGHLAGAGIGVAWDEPHRPRRRAAAQERHGDASYWRRHLGVLRRDGTDIRGQRPPAPDRRTHRSPRRPQLSLSLPTQDPLPRPRSSIVLRGIDRYLLELRDGYDGEIQTRLSLSSERTRRLRQLRVSPRFNRTWWLERAG